MLAVNPSINAAVKRRSHLPGIWRRGLDPGWLTKPFKNKDVLNDYKHETDSFCIADGVKESVSNNENRERNFGSFKKQQNKVVKY